MTGQHYVDLATKIGVSKMEKIALKQFNINQAVIDNIKANSPGDAEKQIREMIRIWAYKPENGENQRTVSFPFIFSKTLTPLRHKHTLPRFCSMTVS